MTLHKLGKDPESPSGGLPRSTWMTQKIPTWSKG